MTSEQIALLDELIENGFVSRTVELLEGTFKATITSSTTADQLAVEGALKITDSIPVHMIHNYQLKLMCRVLKSVTYKGKTVHFYTPEEAEKYLSARPPFIIDALITERSKFEDELGKLTAPEVLDTNFIKPPAIDSDSK